MSFKIHPNYRITITAGDSAEIDLRIFNKDSVSRSPYWHEPRQWFPKAEFPLLDASGELLWKTIQVQMTDSEGKPVWEEDSEGHQILDSEGLPIPVMINNQVPTYPSDMPMFDSEGNEIYGFYWSPEGLMRWGTVIWPEFRLASYAPDRWPWKYKSLWHPLQEEIIFPKDVFVLKVRDIQGNIVLEKENEDYPNTIFLDKADTEYMNPGIYTYQISYITDKDTDAEEEQTIIDEAFFEVYKKYTVSEN